MYQIKRPDNEIDDVLNQATEAEDQGSQWPGMSYEQGVSADLCGSPGRTTKIRWRNEIPRQRYGSRGL